MVASQSIFFYIIAAPKYVRKSAGVRTLYHLCHDLNSRGEQAFIAIYPQFIFHDNEDSGATGLNTPLITQSVLEQLATKGKTPIVIYPEAVRGNPLNAPIVVRYVMNYPGLMGGDSYFPEDEIIYVYSKRLARQMNVADDRIIFMPIADTNFFTPPPVGAKRTGSCFYAAKYRHHHGGKLLPVTDNSVEITRDAPDSQTREQIRDMLQASELFYTYEDTALILEAGLCGCPSVLIPNEFFKESLGLDDIGTDGIAWGTSPEEIARAKATVDRLRGNYEALQKRYGEQLDVFIRQTQSEAKDMGKIPNTIMLPSPRKRGMQTLRFAISYIKRNGLRHFLFKAKYFIRTNGLIAILANAAKNFTGVAGDRQP